MKGDEGAITEDSFLSELSVEEDPLVKLLLPVTEYEVAPENGLRKELVLE